MSFSPYMKHMRWRANPDEEDHRLESRVRENRMHGSEGGEGYPSPTPIDAVDRECVDLLRLTYKSTHARWRLRRIHRRYDPWPHAPAR